MSRRPIRMERQRTGTPPPLAPFARKGGARGPAIPLLPPLPFPLPAPPTEGVRMRAPTTTLSLPSHSREGTPPPPFPIHGEGDAAPYPCCPRSLPFPLGRGKDKGTPPLPFPLDRTAPTREGGMVHARARHPWPLPSQFAWKGCARVARRPPLSVAVGTSRALLTTPPRGRGKGARDPVPPFRIRAEGGRTSMLPPLPVVPGPSPSPLTAPPYARHPHPSRSRGRAAPSPRCPRPFPFPRDRAAPYAREGAREDTRSPAPPFPMRAEGRCTRAHRPDAAPSPRRPRPLPFPRDRPAPGGPMPPPHSVVHGPLWSRRPVRESTPPPGPILPPGRAVRHTRKGAREGKPPPAGGAPFAREGAHEGKPSPPPYVSRSGVDAVSARPRSSRPHRDFRAP
ncbi:hypothetical protein EDB84DRAFT_1567508 [Lactarius hengduanensis]|nr:hypothetical protein EDB84DRAFT_1567508 [Lactarius hengduanensis]